MTKIYLPLSFLGALALSTSLLLGACGDDSSTDEPGSSGGTSSGGSSSGGSGGSSAGKGGQKQGGAGSGDAGKGGEAAGSGGSPAGAGGSSPAGAGGSSPAGAGGSPAGAGGSPAGAGGSPAGAGGSPAGAGGSPAGAGGEGGSPAGGAGGTGMISSCDEISAPGCFSNYDCASETDTCSSLNPNDLVVCCIKGARGKGKAGDPCTGEADCQSALCIDSDKVGKVCTDKCTTPDDCPAGMKKCLYIAGSGSQFNFCAPGDAP